jgi:hypothetical protein
MKTLKHIPAALALVLGLISPSFAQQQPSTTPRPEPDYVTHTSFKSKIFDVKNRDAESLARVLRSLGSGFKGATVQSNSEFRTITVRDFPENIATIEEALKRLDVPGAARPNIELQMHVLIASNTGGVGGDMPAEIRDVLPQLRNTLNYRNYELATSVVQRLTETPRGLQGTGTAEISSGGSGPGPFAMPYEYYISQVSFVQNATGSPSVQIGEFTFTTTSDKERARIQTALTIRDGEKVVVGTATLRSRALIVVLIAKLK